jgi:GGDEF domain-containing protein
MSAPELRPAALAVAPTLAAVLTASAGLLLLASGATPSEPTRFALLLAFAPAVLIETSHFVFQGDSIPVTISIGVAMLSDADKTSTDLIRAADAKLYEAKRGGRNKVVG